MTGDADHDLDPEDQALVAEVQAERPVPSSGFRGALGRYLARRDPGYGPRPPLLRLRALAWIAAGTVLLAVGTLQATSAIWPAS